jgi:hypothetical protein
MVMLESDGGGKSGSSAHLRDKGQREPLTFKDVVLGKEKKQVEDMEMGGVERVLMMVLPNQKMLDLTNTK